MKDGDETTGAVDPIRLEGLRKTFRVGFWRRKVEAVREVTFSVHRGEIFGLVGPNGAGKTTTIKMLTGLVRPDRGRAELFGRPAERAEGRRRLGYLPEAPYFYEHLNVRELLFYYGSLHGLPRREIRRRAETLIERVGLAHAADRPIRRFSKGMRQRAGLAQALINDPEVVILDEPQSGLDPVGRKDVRDLIFELKEQGKTVLFSSHILPDVEAVCDRVALLHLGTLREVGSLAELTSRSTDSVEVRAQGVRPEDLSGLDGLLRIEQRGAQWVLRVAEEAQLQAVIEAIYAAGGKIHAVVPHRHDLEDVFLRDTAAAAPPPGADAARGGE